MIERGVARALVARLAAAARPAGSEAEEEVRRYCEQWLRESGFQIERQSFEYSAFPGRWATPLGGLAGLTAAVAIALLIRNASPGAALFVSILSAGVLSAAGWWLARRGVLDLPVLRARSVNLAATRGTPRIWLVAHLDTKSQPVPMLGRVAGIVGLSAMWIALTVVAIAVVRGAVSLETAARAAHVLALLAFVFALPVIASTVGTHSAGAVDDGTGVAAALLSAREAPPDLPLGVLLTSGEELGLAGAMAWVRARAMPPGVAINFEGLDDRGRLLLMSHGSGSTGIAGRMLAAAASAGQTVQAVRSIPGVLTDGVALRQAGWDVVTVAAGSIATLNRIHTPLDTVDRLTGDAVARVVHLAGNVLRER